jgi:hypothetical protein
VLERLCLLLLGLVITGLSMRSAVGHDPLSGRALFAITPSHGIDTGDLPVIAAWLLGMICCGLLWRRTGPR